MAPECLSGNPYNLKADVYTFAIILWEILSGQTPYAFVRRRHQLTDYVVEENGRPVIEESWPSDIQDMLERSFDPEIENRPVSALMSTSVYINYGHQYFLTVLSPRSTENDIMVYCHTQYIGKSTGWRHGGFRRLLDH
ncbi:hypothetical protein ACHAXR_003677 [Thalassiosira sp. AJA248-18]